MSPQLSLFDDPTTEGLQQDYLGIQGLAYLPQLLRPEAQIRLLSEINRMPWQDDLKRRVQHYGYKYDYKAHAINLSMYVGPLPTFALEVAHQILSHGLITEMPDQLIVNEYQPGQGISAHIDCRPCFKDSIVTVSLESAYEMDFINVESGMVRVARLEAGGALVLKGDARYRWMHRIKARKSDHRIPRGRRVSLTFRNVIIGKCSPENETACPIAARECQ